MTKSAHLITEKMTLERDLWLALWRRLERSPFSYYFLQFVRFAPQPLDKRTAYEFNINTCIRKPLSLVLWFSRSYQLEFSAKSDKQKFLWENPKLNEVQVTFAGTERYPNQPMRINDTDPDDVMKHIAGNNTYSFFSVLRSIPGVAEIVH
jgi:hypothetical protein